MELPYVHPYRIKVVEEMKTSTRAQREQWIAETQYNLFDLKSHQVFMDVMTDSGTGGLSDKQWAAMMTGDESYAGSESFENLKQTIREITGYKYVIPAHQGRASENVLMSGIIKEGDIVPGNMQFFTTKIHIEKHGGKTVDCTTSECKDLYSDFPFKGNVDLEKLEAIYKEYGKEKIPFCLLTITCNSVGGQPVSMENIKAVSKLSKQYGIPIIYDSARFAQNAYFIKVREEAYFDKSIQEIVRETFDLADGMFMSSKKDGLVNMGGFVALRSAQMYEDALPHAVLNEGFATYGGMSGLAMNSLAQGLKEAITFSYLKSRIHQVEYLGQKLMEYEVPIQQPIAGHAIFINALEIMTEVPRDEFPSHVLSVEIYKEGGLRLGNGNTYPKFTDPKTGEEKFVSTDLLRLCIPQRLYTTNHLDYMAAVIKNVYDRRKEYTSGYKVIYEPKAAVMKMFGVKLERL